MQLDDLLLVCIHFESKTTGNQFLYSFHDVLFNNIDFIKDLYALVLVIYYYYYYLT